MRLRELPKDQRGRPIVGAMYGVLIRALAETVPDKLGHLDPTRFLIVSAAARRESSASIRPFTFGGSPPKREYAGFKKPRVTVGGVVMLYEIALRPKYFAKTSWKERLGIFAHELWHVSPAFDGSLAEERRHDGEEIDALEREVGEICARFSASKQASIGEELLGWRGELRISSWMARPPSREPRAAKTRLDYDERDLFLSVVEQG